MKRLIKRSNRKGFTLVETLLATFILVVISTMLINGFLTTMGYSYQTAVYNKSASMNYALCMQYSGTWGRKATNLDNGREAEAFAQNYVTSNNHELEFLPGPDYIKPESLSVAIIKNDDLSATVPGTLSFGSEVFAPTDDHLVDNRTSIVYFPEYCSNGNANVGEIVVMLDVSDPENPTYYWVVAEHKSDESKDPYDANNKLKKDFDLTSLTDDDIIAEVGNHEST